jgi:hypothetical protein
MKRSLLIACAVALTTLATSASAIQLKDIKVNGIPYTAGMTAPAPDTLKLSGTLVIEPQDDWYNLALGQNEPYDGFGFFAAGSDPCVVLSPLGKSTTDDPNSQIYWPDTSRCAPTFAIAKTIDTSVGTNIFELSLKFNQSTGAFSNIDVPVAGVSGADFVVTYQLNHWMWGTSSAQGADPYHRAIDSLASLRWNTSVSQIFMPQATLSFAKPTSCGSTAQMTASASGTLTAQTLRVNVVPSCSEQAASGKFWIAAIVPGGSTFILQANGSWSAYSSTASLDNLATASGIVGPRIFSLAEGANLSQLVGTEIWAGYGSDAATMLSSGKASKVYTVK